MLRKLMFLGTMAVTCVAAASPLNYAVRSVPIRAGIVLLESQQAAPTHPANDAPYVFYNLDSNRNIKPGGWTFSNPLAPSRVTAEVQIRWFNLTGQNYTIDEPVTKRTGAYWEVRLDKINEAQITQFDLLLVPCTRFVQLNPSEREKLRRFVENGGTLWVDVRESATLDGFNSFPLPVNVGNNNLGGAFGFDAFHPLMNRPNFITNADIANMDSGTLLGLRDVVVPGDLDIQQSALRFDSLLLASNPVIEDERGTTVAVAQLGEGHMVTTTRGISRTLNQVIDTSGTLQANVGLYGVKPVFSRSSDSAAKLVINMAFLSSGYGQIGKGPRKTNGSAIDLGAPMLKKFSAPLGLNPGNYNYVPPTVYKGIIFVSDGNRLYAFDSDPRTDRDNDSNPDDGIADFSVGSNYDLIWQSTGLTGPLSPPTAAEVPGASIRDQIAMVDGSGRLLIFNANPANPLVDQAPNVFNAPTNSPEIEPGVAGRGPYAPTYHDGMYFVSDQVNAGLSSVGRVWMFDALNQQVMSTNGPWVVGGPSAPIMQRPSASPTVGYVPINDGSGGLDRVIYVPTRPNASGGPNNTSAIHSLWLGVKGEKPFAVTQSGNNLFVVTRASLQGLSIFRPTQPHPLGVKLSIIDQNGNTLNATQMDTLFTSSFSETSGVITFTFEAGQSLPANASVRIDYTIDWGRGTPGLSSQVLRGQLFLPDNVAKRRRVLGNIVMGPEGVIHLVHSDPNPSNTQGGAYYAFREERRGEFRMLSKFELFPQHQIPLNGATPVTYRETLGDVDPIQSAPGAGAFLGGPFTALRFTGPPSLHKDIIYIPAGGTKRGFIPCTILMAFKAVPPTPEVVVGDLGPGFQVLQPDLSRSDNRTQPTVLSVFTGQNYTYEYSSSASKGVLRFENLMQVPRGFIGNSLNLSQPLIIRRNGQPDVIIEPNASGNRWNPMLWYVVLHGWDGDNGASPALVTGNTVFIAGASALPNLLETGFSVFPPQPRGLLFAMNADIAPNDPFLRSDTVRPWQKQAINFEFSPTFRGNPNVRWPQYAGATDFTDWAIRLFQTTLGNSLNSFGVVGGDDVLASWSEQGLWAFSRADYIVADEGRLARFDGSGNPIWTADAAIKTSLETNSGVGGETKPLVRPTKAYVMNARELMVVDTGANRIVRLDINGRESRSIDQFNLDPTFRPEGYVEGASAKLREPKDVITWTSYQNNPTQFNNPQAREYWIHYLIADSGNKRLIELIDRYRINPTTGRNEGLVRHTDNSVASGILYWHTPAAYSGKDFDFNSLSRVWAENTSNPALSQWVYAAGIGSTMPARVDLGLDVPTPTVRREAPGGNGGIVLFNNTNTVVINEVLVPAIGANVFWDGAGNFSSAARPARVKKLSSLNSVTMRNVDDPAFGGRRIAIMFTDSEGVFEIVQSGADWVVRWMMPREAYKVMRRFGSDISISNPLDLRATYAKRLDSGEVLIVNGYIGKTIGGAEFNGEVVTVNGDVDTTNNNSIAGFGFNKTNFSFYGFSVRAELPPIQGARGLVVPVFADRR